MASNKNENPAAGTNAGMTNGKRVWLDDLRELKELTPTDIEIRGIVTDVRMAEDGKKVQLMVDDGSGECIIVLRDAQIDDVLKVCFPIRPLTAERIHKAIKDHFLAKPISVIGKAWSDGLYVNMTLTKLAILTAEAPYRNSVIGG